MKTSAKILLALSIGLLTIDTLGATAPTTISYPTITPVSPSVSQIPRPSTHIAQSDDKAIIVKSNDDRIEIKLAANATTGYQWFVKHYDHNLLNLMSYHYLAPGSNLAGAGGTAVFVFEVESTFHRAPQISTVTFEYGQPWNLSLMKTHKVTVVSAGISNMAAPGTNLRYTEPSASMPVSHYDNSFKKITPRYSTTQPVIAPVTPPQASGQVMTPITGNATQRVQMPRTIKGSSSSSTGGATGQTNHSSQDDWVSLPTSSSTPSK